MQYPDTTSLISHGSRPPRTSRKRRPARPALLLLLVLFLSPASCDEHRYDITLWFEDSDLRARVSGIELFLLPSCDEEGDATATTLLDAFRPWETPSLPNARPGEHGLYVVVRDARCEVIGDGCTTVRMEAEGSGSLVVSVDEVEDRGTCGPYQTCDAGLCVTHTDGDADADADGDTDADADADYEQCTPICAGRECGSDGCDGTCEPGCVDQQLCDPNGHCFTIGAFVALPAGTFGMGAPLGELGRDEDEVSHDVTLTHPFEILSTEVTIAEFRSLFPEYTPCTWDCEGCPADCVTWHQAALYCNELSDENHLEQCYQCSGVDSSTRCEIAVEIPSPYDCEGYRLPTEAEWEYAVRAGSVTATYGGDLSSDSCDTELSKIANYGGLVWSGSGNCGPDRSFPVGSLLANDWGLTDMLGNVEELTHDTITDYPDFQVVDPWTGTEGFKIVRGGHFESPAGDVRAANRYRYDPTQWGKTLGFRPVRTLPLE